MTRGKLRREIDAGELADWKAYRSLYGFPVDRLEAAVALSGAYVGAVFGGKAEAKDLVPEFDRADPTPEELAAKMKAIAEVFRLAEEERRP